MLYRLLTATVAGIALSLALSAGGPLAAGVGHTVEGHGGAVTLTAWGEPVPTYRSALGKLDAGQSMHAGDTITSTGGRYQLIMQKEGNLVLYDARTNPAHPAPVWASPTDGNPGARADMQKEGNLVIYNAANKPVWTTPTDKNPGASLRIGDDGHLAIVGPGGNTVWTAP